MIVKRGTLLYFLSSDTSLKYEIGDDCVALDIANDKWIAFDCELSYKYICNKCETEEDESILAHPAFLVPVFCILMIIVAFVSMYYTIKAKKKKKAKINAYMNSLKLNQKTSGIWELIQVFLAELQVVKVFKQYPMILIQHVWKRAILNLLKIMKNIFYLL